MAGFDQAEKGCEVSPIIIPILSPLRVRFGPRRCPHCGKVLPADHLRIWPILLSVVITLPVLVFFLFGLFDWLTDLNDTHATLLQIYAGKLRHLFSKRLW